MLATVTNHKQDLSHHYFYYHYHYYHAMIYTSIIFGYVIMYDNLTERSLLSAIAPITITITTATT